jgi:hypothetical protein
MLERIMPQPLSFTCPAVGPRHYVARGSSGWPETWLRTQADAALRIFISPLDLPSVVRNFYDEQKSKRDEHARHETLWSDVLGYLARVRGRSNALTATVAIAFWGQVVLLQRELEPEEDDDAN